MSCGGDRRRAQTRCFSLTFKARKKLDLAVTSDLSNRAIGAVALQGCNRMSRRMMATPFFHIPIAPQSQAQADTDEEGVRET